MAKVVLKQEENPRFGIGEADDHDKYIYCVLSLVDTTVPYVGTFLTEVEVVELLKEETPFVVTIK